MSCLEGPLALRCLFTSRLKVPLALRCFTVSRLEGPLALRCLFTSRSECPLMLLDLVPRRIQVTAQIRRTGVRDLQRSLGLRVPPVPKSRTGLKLSHPHFQVFAEGGEALFLPGAFVQAAEQPRHGGCHANTELQSTASALEIRQQWQEDLRITVGGDKDKAFALTEGPHACRVLEAAELRLRRCVVKDGVVCDAHHTDPSHFHERGLIDHVDAQSALRVGVEGLQTIEPDGLPDVRNDGLADGKCLTVTGTLIAEHLHETGIRQGRAFHRRALELKVANRNGG